MPKTPPNPTEVLEQLDRREREIGALRSVLSGKQRQIVEAMSNGTASEQQRKELGALARELDDLDAEVDALNDARRLARKDQRTAENVARYQRLSDQRDKAIELHPAMIEAHVQWVEFAEKARVAQVEVQRLDGEYKQQLWEVFAATFDDVNRALGQAATILGREVEWNDALAVVDQALDRLGVEVGCLPEPPPKPAASLRPPRPEATKPAETALPRPKGDGRVYPGYGAFIRETDPNASPADPRNMASVPPQPKAAQPKLQTLAEAAGSLSPVIDPNILADGPPKVTPR